MNPPTEPSFLAPTQIEIIASDIPKGRFRYALFDFDGTLSLIREGWQDIMVPYFVECLQETSTNEREEELEQLVKEFVMRLTGKQTIYQTIQLKEEIEKRGGTAKDPLEYKHIYLDRLWQRIHNRVDGLKSGELDPADYVVPGSYELLEGLKARGLTLYLASGTDLPYVKDELATLKMDPYFGPHVYGALDDYKNFSKKMIIQKILKENHLSGPELLTFGDGYVEIEDTKAVEGVAVGVASDEAGRVEVDGWKRTRLINAGADLIVPHYGEWEKLLEFLFGE